MSTIDKDLYGNDILSQIIARSNTKAYSSWVNHQLVDDSLDSLTTGDIFPSSKKKNEFVKQYVINEAAEDLLALSHTWYRIRTGNVSAPEISSLTDPALFGCVKAEDRIAANVIRDYYSKKVMMWALKEVKLTKFRADLSTFIHSTGKLFTDETLPLVFRLPEFYAYDTEFEEMKKNFTADIVPKHFSNTTMTLYPVKNLNRKLRSGHKHEYWFKNVHGQAVLMLIDHHNCCMSLWNREFRKESMIITGTFSQLTQDDLSYYKVFNWGIE